MTKLTPIEQSVDAGSTESLKSPADQLSPVSTTSGRSKSICIARKGISKRLYFVGYCCTLRRECCLKYCYMLHDNLHSHFSSRCGYHQAVDDHQGSSYADGDRVDVSCFELVRFLNGRTLGIAEGIVELSWLGGGRQTSRSLTLIYSLSWYLIDHYIVLLDSKKGNLDVRQTIYEVVIGPGCQVFAANYRIFRS